MSDISDRIRETCAQKGTSMYKLEKQLNLGNGTIGKWGKNGRQPTYDKVSAVADALDVSVDYLLTGEQKEKPDLHQETGLSPSKKKLLSLIDELSNEQCEKLFGIIEEAIKLL